VRGRQRRDHEAQRQHRAQRRDLGLAIEVAQRAGEQDAARGEHDAGADGQPERGRAVVLGEVLALDDRRADRHVREDEDEAREDEHHRREAEVVRCEQPREDDRDDDARALQRDLRAGLPREAAENPATDAHRTARRAPRPRSSARCHPLGR
jgi:hypothetical protein